MQDRSVVITDTDMDRLTLLVQAYKHSLFRDQQQADLLDQKLAGAEVRTTEQVPGDLIRMHSRVRVFDFDRRRTRVYTLAFPHEANIARSMVSVLAPLGIALLGWRKGDVIEAQVPGGTRKLRVDDVRQQSAVGGMRPSDLSSARRTSHLPRSYETALTV